MIQFLMILIADNRRKMDERGASAVEYGLLIAGIAAVVVVAVLLLGETVTGAFNGVEDQIDGVPAPE